MAQTKEGWIEAFAEKVGIEPPNEQEIDTLLSIAGVAAHASERSAAPLTCWMIAKAGITPEAALEIANAIASESPS